jgi:putative hydrolase of the HAD superfamily
VFLDAGQTLLEADPPVESVYCEAFAAHGVGASVKDVRHAIHATWTEVGELRLRGEERWGNGGGEAGFWRRFVSRIYERVGGAALPEALLHGLVAHFRDERHWRLYPEVRDVLPALRERGLRLIVVSNWDSSLPGLLERLGVTPFLDGLVVSASFGASKPARAIFDEAVRLAGVPAAEALHVGDSLEEDYLAARAAGLQALLVDRTGHHTGQAETIASLDELLTRLPMGVRRRA